MLAPTRELAQQITSVFRDLMGSEDEFKVLCTFGGMGLERQGDALRGGIDIVVGTTGRTLDFVNRGDLVLADLRVMVLDEADKMFENNFMDDITEIISQIDGPAQAKV